MSAQESTPTIGYRLTIEAVGLRQSDAAAHALTLIGMMMQDAHDKGHSCGGTTGNASGRWERLPNGRDEPRAGSAASPKQ
jgi:hypothetical protein